MSLTTL